MVSRVLEHSFQPVKRVLRFSGVEVCSFILLAMRLSTASLSIALAALIFLSSPSLSAAETAFGDDTYNDASALRAAAVSPDEMNVAVRRFEKAAAFGNARSLIALGDIFASGQLVPQDEIRAKAFYELAAPGGLERESARGLGAIFRSPDGALHDPVQALIHFKSAAALGDSNAAAELTEMYSTGEGVTADEETARFYFNKAIETGNAPDVVPKLAGLLRSPEGVLYDPVEAFKLFEQAVALGHARSLITLGEMSELGEGVAADEIAAAKYFEQASLAGFEAYAARRMAAMYRSKEGALYDLAEAGRLYEKSAELGDARSLLALGEMVASGEGFEADERKAKSYLDEASLKGLEREATRELANIYRSPEGELNDLQEALRLYESAISLGDFGSLLALGDIHAAGIGIEQDEEAAKAYYDKAAEAGLLKERAGRMAGLYLSPEGVFFDIQLAFQFFEEAAALGDQRAAISLGRLYAKGEGVALDELRAKALFELAASHGLESEAYRRLADLYRSPEGELYDIGQAIGLFEQAVALGDIQSLTSLGEIYASGEALNIGSAKSGQKGSQGTN